MLFKKWTDCEKRVLILDWITRICLLCPKTRSELFFTMYDHYWLIFLLSNLAFFTKIVIFWSFVKHGSMTAMISQNLVFLGIQEPFTTSQFLGKIIVNVLVWSFTYQIKSKLPCNALSLTPFNSLRSLSIQHEYLQSTDAHASQPNPCWQIHWHVFGIISRWCCSWRYECWSDKRKQLHYFCNGESWLQ